MELTLPKEAQVWSVFVSGEPTRPRSNDKKILIPLNRSKLGASGLAAFEVELIYYEKKSPFTTVGNRATMFPVPDILLSQMTWSVYLPLGYSYFNFGGTVEKEKVASGLSSFLGARSQNLYTSRSSATTPSSTSSQAEFTRQQSWEVQQMKQQFSKNLALTDEQLAYQIDNERNFGQRVQQIQGGQAPLGKGFLPIRIHVPKTGQIFRFAKTIVSEEPMTLEFTFIDRGLTSLFVLIIVIFILFVAIFIYNRVKKSVSKKVTREVEEVEGEGNESQVEKTDNA
jgi:hypothetical protein